MTVFAYLGVVYGVLALGFMILFVAADRLDTRRRRLAPIVAIRELPLASVHIATKWRRERW